MYCLGWEVHFSADAFEQQRQDGWKKLRPGAVPTLFPYRGKYSRILLIFIFKHKCVIIAAVSFASTQCLRRYTESKKATKAKVPGSSVRQFRTAASGIDF